MSESTEYCLDKSEHEANWNRDTATEHPLMLRLARSAYIENRRAPVAPRATSTDGVESNAAHVSPVSQCQKLRPRLWNLAWQRHYNAQFHKVVIVRARAIVQPATFGLHARKTIPLSKCHRGTAQHNREATDKAEESSSQWRHRQRTRGGHHYWPHLTKR